jgi:predicted nucleic acid-binding protein
MTDALHHTVLCYDIQGSAGLDNSEKGAAREFLTRAFRDTCTATQIDVAGWEDRGDGAMIYVPAAVPKIRLIGPWLDAVHATLAERYAVAEGWRVQVRLAVHTGELRTDRDGYYGADIDYAARLVDTQAAKDILAATPPAALVVVVSEIVFQQVVRHARPARDPASFAPVPLRVKEVDGTAWVYLPGWARVPQPPVGVIGVANVQGSFYVNGTGQ